MGSDNCSVVLVCGAPWYVGRKEVVAAIEGLDTGVLVRVGNQRGLDKAIQGAVNGRGLSLGTHIITRREDETTPALVERLLGGIHRAIIFTDGRDRWSMTLLIAARRAGIPVEVIRGQCLKAEVVEVERASTIDAAMHAEWRTVESDERERFFEHGAAFVGPEVDYHAHDVLNPERQLERDGWDWQVGLSPHAEAHLVRVGSTGVRTIDGRHVQISTPNVVRWERPSPWIDAFRDEDELPNLDDYTMDECAIIDEGLNTRFAGAIMWRIKHGVPLARDLFEDIRQEVEAR